MTSSLSTTKNLARLLGIKAAKTTYPTGDRTFSVKQSFPAAFDEFESDPFLMCDYFSMKSKVVETDPDSFPVRWHPHKGMDICSYMKEGIGRHGDSMGNRETFATPGLQWISVGSGIEHAEGGATPVGEPMTGFQIWINVPAKHKLDDPEYGTVEPSELPLLKFEEGAVQARLLAGEYAGQHGPFHTKQPLQMLDYMLSPGVSSWYHEIPRELDNCVLYVYDGAGKINGQAVTTFDVLHVDASSPTHRTLALTSGAAGLSVMVFVGKRIGEPIAWHGPFVMNTQDEITQTLRDYQLGRFPPKRTAWDYKRFAAFPQAEQERLVAREREALARIHQGLGQPTKGGNGTATAAVSSDGKVVVEQSKEKTNCL